VRATVDVTVMAGEYTKVRPKADTTVHPVKILLAPHGTRGDVQPMLALARALRGRGHDVRFVAPADFVAWLRAEGFDVESDGVDVESTLRAAGAHNLESFRWQARHLADVLIPAQFESVVRASEDVDAIVGAGVQIAAASVAEWREAAYVTVCFCPCAIPSADAPPPLVRTQTLPRFLNWLLWMLGLPAADLLIRRPINTGRRRLGLEPITGALGDLLGQGIVVAADRELGPVGPDAPDCVVQTDAWILETADALDDRVDRFLGLEPAPIYVGFGSMMTPGARALAADAVSAARALGRGALLVGGWAGLDRYVEEADDVVAVATVPHRLVLPRVAVAVHHGGAGTTHAVARAGVPQVVLPHILDQFYWAHRVERLGLGPRPVPVGIVNADVLTDRIAAALADPSIRQAAAVLGQAIASRNGVEDGVDAVELLVAPSRSLR
jgi:vancomycin aglycone glucosyltransferase